ncbi:MAG: DUF1080 domain-containing protein [Bacteroidota bacterium]|nr:DUF1080 domain-containing protein [Bacteroidota bacterium]
MNFFKKAVFCLPVILGCSLAGRSQQTGQLQPIPLQNLDAFRDPGKNWNLASNASADPEKEGNMKAIPGEGAVVDIMNPKDNTHLITKEEYGDLQLELDFMMAKNSNSGVFLEGRYEVQLLDSWTKTHPQFSDCGGIYQRWDDARGQGREGYEGVPPLMGVARAPGLWQHLKIIFTAPKFNDKGEKIANARFEKVFLNGVLIQVGVDVTGPTRSSYFQDEKPTGPLMLQGDHGNVAFRNIRYGKQDNAKAEESTDNPILLNPQGRPYLLRSFLNYGDRKLTHVISDGNPDQLNFSYNLKQGALFQIWRGDFLDVTEMWHDRGEPQLAKPRGSLLILSDAPALAVLATAEDAWPDSIAFDDFHNEGYTLDAGRIPTFQYAFKGMEVADKISGQAPQFIRREIAVTNAATGLYCRIAAAKSIEMIDKNLYAVDDRTYYIRLDERFKPVIRSTAAGKELIVPISQHADPLIYSITF